LQNGEDDRYLKIAANCKAYNAYDLEEWNGTDRFHFDAQISDQDLVETYLPPFESCIRDARAASVMCSYNAINGIPLCANTFQLDTLAR
jgi:beta-D-xylosidase 4